MNGVRFVLLLLVIVQLTHPFRIGIAQRQDIGRNWDSGDPGTKRIADPCVDPSTHPALRDALRLLCSRPRPEVASCSDPKAIVVGFVGGFARPDDVKHPEVLFASYLRTRYGAAIRAEVFGNHDGKKAVERVTGWLDSDGDRSIEKESVKIIIYGHSWGASQVLELARELQRREIPVALTIQIDSIRKWRQDDRTVPANVKTAINFFQTGGLTRGRAHIVPADPARTRILGNIRMSHRDDQVRCDNYPWLPRTLNKPHHEIENDPHVWDQIGSLIDAEMSNRCS